jgi:hypothetical protein
MPHSDSITKDMRECIATCMDCTRICTETVNHSLQLSGKHSDARHIRLLLDCAEICATCVAFMLRGSDFHHQTCRVCAEVCNACAESCRGLADGDATLKECADICKRCATSCQHMAAAPPR